MPYPLYLACAKCGSLAFAGESNAMSGDLWKRRKWFFGWAGIDRTLIPEICEHCKKNFVAAVIKPKTKTDRKGTPGLFQRFFKTLFGPKLHKDKKGQLVAEIIIPPFNNVDGEQRRWRRKAKAEELQDAVIPTEQNNI